MDESKFFKFLLATLIEGYSVLLVEILRLAQRLVSQCGLKDNQLNEAQSLLNQRKTYDALYSKKDG
ncbi:hypothetical protein [Fundicoccus ignavus]|uniref:hypothetical protein n=1 Tax=Fundicoccus ignavus TaxID=2664442 RepID=UPI00156268DB|nr:hypothetical protein [Fundicoccus ignavus]